MISTAVKYAQILLVLFLGLLLFFSARLSTVIPLETRQIVGISFGLFSGILFYYDRILARISSGRTQIEHMTLGEAMRSALKLSDHTKKMQVYAYSTFVIQSLFASERAKAEKCEIIIYKGDGSVQTSESSRSVIPMRAIPIKQWCLLRCSGIIRDLDIFESSLNPSEYFVIFDDRIAILGHYLIRDGQYPHGCEVQDPVLIGSDTAEGRLQIAKLREVFERHKKSRFARRLNLCEYSYDEMAACEGECL